MPNPSFGCSYSCRQIRTDASENQCYIHCSPSDLQSRLLLEIEGLRVSEAEGAELEVEQ